MVIKKLNELIELLLNYKFLFLTIPLIFGISLTLRPFPFGADSYYFINSTCHDFSENDTTPVLAKLFFETIGCHNLIIFTPVILATILMICLILLYFSGRVFDKKLAHYPPLFFVVSVMALQSFAELEDDVLSYPFLFLSNFFLIKLIFEKNETKKWFFTLMGLISIIIAGFFWKGAFLYLFQFFFYWFSTKFQQITNIIFPLTGFLIGSFTVNFQVRENLPFIGLIGLSLSLFPLFLSSSTIPVSITLFWFALAALNSKMIIHLTFFASLLSIFLINGSFNNFANQLFMKKALKEKKTEEETKKRFIERFISLTSIVALLSCTLIFFAEPTAKQMIELKEIVNKTGNELLNNDWGVGYWIDFLGGNAKNKGTVAVIEPKGIVLIRTGSENDYKLQNCKLNYRGDYYSTFDCGPFS